MKKIKQPAKGTGFNFGGFPKGKGISGKGGKTTNYCGTGKAKKPVSNTRTKEESK